jgi:hypothetical protein
MFDAKVKRAGNTVATGRSQGPDGNGGIVVTGLQGVVYGGSLTIELYDDHGALVQTIDNCQAGISSGTAATFHYIP